MQVSAQNSLTWLQSTPALTVASDPLASAAGQLSPGGDASGSGSGQGAMSALQSPSQMFASSSLGSLISSQSDASGSDATSSAATSSTATTGAPSIPHHHHHHGGGAPPVDSQDDSGASSSTTTTATGTSATTATDSTDASAEAELSQILTNL